MMSLRNKLFLALCLFSILIPATLMAQDKQLTLHDLIPGGKTYSRFVPANLNQLQWCGNEYMYIKGDSVMMAAVSKPQRLAFTRKQLNVALTAAGADTLGSLPGFTPLADNPQVLTFRAKGHRIHYDYKAGKVTADYRLKSEWANLDFCPANGYLAFTEGNDIRMISSDNDLFIVTRETSDGVVCGQAVHQQEFGIHKGTFWSPKGSALAFYRMDESMVTDYPLVDVDARPSKMMPHTYPMAGMKSHEVKVGVYGVSTGETVWLETGKPKEKYLTNMAWSPDEKSIYIAELNREQNEMNLVRYSARTGKKEAELFTEKAERYVEPQQPVLFVPGSNDQFIWQSQKDGFNHLYLYDTTGKQLKQLTSGEWVVLSVLGFDAGGSNLFISATAPQSLSAKGSGTPMEVYTWKVNLKTGKRTCLTTAKGVHRTSVSPSGLYAIDQVSTPSIPRNINILRVKDGAVVTSLLTAKNPYAEYTLPEIVTGTIKAADGVTDLNYRLIKPVGWEADKKYPTVVYVYGGPHSQLVTGDWMNGARGWDLYMAQRGYVMFTLDSRGTSNRGYAFESVIHRNLGVHEMADQVKGVEFLKSLPYVDADRVGVHGWSYGGFMTTNLMLTYPDLFKVGVAGGPVIDWSLYEIMYGERYMDRPQDNPEGYKNANLKLKAANLKGRLLLIHGDVDPVVVWQHSLGFLKACVKADTYPDYFVYPGHEHNVTGKDRPHLHEKITRYFDDYLK